MALRRYSGTSSRARSCALMNSNPGEPCRLPAQNFRARCSYRAAPQASAQTQLTPAQCQAIWNLQRAACEAKYHSDRRTWGAITVGCFIGCAVICAATNWGYAICLAVCWAGCVAYEVGCLNDADGDYNACIAAADAARMACEPGWTAPAVN